jgi:RecG-like helicase
VRAAEDEFRRLNTKGVFGDKGCGLLHGKMTAEQKAAVLQEFSRWVGVTYLRGASGAS